MIEAKDYSGAKLCAILEAANREKTPPELIHEQQHYVRCFVEYLGPKGLNAKFYVEEPEYISAEYLTDYSFYYSKNFDDPGNKCVRLHFFTDQQTDRRSFQHAFEKAILDGNFPEHAASSAFWEKQYLGFIVVRPIPKFLIGYTILRHYNFREDSKAYDLNRDFWAVKTYEAHVFGTTVKLQSLAFLSQDSNVAACATIAVWCTLQRGVENYYINLKSPYEITKDAGLTVHDGNRIFPNNGLNFVAICRAVTLSNLATEFRDLKTNTTLERNNRIRQLVNAYACIKLPIILGMTVPSRKGEAKHAVAVTGHHWGEKPYYTEPKYKAEQIAKAKAAGKPIESRPIFYRSDFINKLYLHDDQWGPFSRCELLWDDTFANSWTIYADRPGPSRALALVIPVFQKIRIPFEDIQQYAVGLNNFLKKELAGKVNGVFVWDIQLYLSNDFKEEVQRSGLVNISDPDQARQLNQLLTKPLPKYCWVTTLFIDDKKLMNFVYDATGLRHTSSLLFGFSYYRPFVANLIAYLEMLEGKHRNEPKVLLRLEGLLGDALIRVIKALKNF